MKYYSKAMIAALMGLSVMGCSSNDDATLSPSPEEPVVPQDKVVYSEEDIFSKEQTPRKAIALQDGGRVVNDRVREFSWDIFGRLMSARKSDESSVLFSPLNFSQNLMMLANGLTGDTQSELMSAMGLGDVRLSDANSYVETMNGGLVDADSRSRYYACSSVWYRNDFAMNRPFAESLGSYSAETFPARMDNATLDSINTWVADKSYGRLQKTLEEINRDMGAVLVNTMYFRGLWQHRVVAESAQPEMFRNEDGTETRTDLLHTVTHNGYFENESFQAAQLSIGNAAYAMVYILPREGVSAADALQSYVECRQSVEDGMSTDEVQLAFPRYKASSRFTMKQMLTAAGVERIFDSASSGDFCMFDKPMFIKDIFHNTSLSVDENGVEGAAVTVSGHLTSSGKEHEVHYVTLNRPFYYAVVETSTKAPLFIGYHGSMK